MPNYNQQQQFYAGVDLHARSMYLHIVDAKGKAVYERDLFAGRADCLALPRRNREPGCVSAGRPYETAPDRMASRR